MTTFKIPITWQCWGLVSIKAGTLEEATNLAVTEATPLPDGEYIDDSIRVDWEELETYNP